MAGLFSDSPKSIPLPIDYSDDEFDRMLECHLRILPFSSPFISTTGTPLAPIHRALRNREGAVLTLIDSSQIQTKVYSAQQLMWQKNIKIPRYRGTDEFLIWGEIPSQAILCSIKITDLERIAEDHPDIRALLKLDVIASFKRIRKRLRKKLSLGHGRLDGATGFTVGKLLRYIGIPDMYTDNVAERIASSWRFKKKQGSLAEYLEGVRDGYISSDPASSVPSVSNTPIRNISESITSKSIGERNRNGNERDTAGVYTEDDSDSEEDDEDDGEEDEEEKGDDSDSFTIVETPCPPPRARITETHSPMADLCLPSPTLEHPPPDESPGLFAPFNTTSRTRSPADPHDRASRPAKRTKKENPSSERRGIRIEVFNPASRSWLPLANQTGFIVANTQPGHNINNNNNIITIIDDDSDCNENKAKNKNHDTDTFMSEAPDLGIDVQNQSGHYLGRGREPESEDRFTRERARVEHILKLHGMSR